VISTERQEVNVHSEAVRSLPSLQFGTRKWTRLLVVIWQQAASPQIARLTPRTTPDLSSNGTRTFAQLCCRLAIGYDRAPHIFPLNYHLLGTDPQTQIIPRPIWSTHLTYHPKWHPCLISHFAQCTVQTGRHTDTHRQTHRQTDRQTNRWLEAIFNDYKLLLLYRELCLKMI